MVCEHLRRLEEELLEEGFRETYRGQAWGKNCREWVYFDCYLDRESIRQRLELESCVEDHDHLGTHDGCESGFYCRLCHDGVMGLHEAHRTRDTEVFR